MIERPKLQQAVEEMRDLLEGIKEAERKELKARLQNLKISKEPHKTSKNQVTRSEIIDDRFEDTQEMESHEPNLKQKLIAKHFKDLSPSCQKILNLFYYRGWSINEIVMGTEYKDENTVKSHKSRCLKGLKEKIVTD